MKKIYLTLAGISLLMTGCNIIGGIFKAGVWTGIFLVAIVLGLIIFLVSRGSKRK